MGKIVTVTLNPAIDRVIETPRQPASPPEGLLFPAGKGINVARTVETLGKEVVVLGLVGHSARPLFDTLQSPLLRVKLTEVPGTTRTNVTVYDPTAKTTNHTRTAGFYITTEDVARLDDAMRETVAEGDIVVLTGSLPQGAEVSMYRDMISCLQAHGARTILDSSGDELARGLEATPFMVKPNVEELEAATGRVLSAEAEIIEAAQQIRDRGIHLVVVSRGSEGVIVVFGGATPVLKANVAVDDDYAPTGSVGSGDALVGGVAVGLLEGLAITDVVRLGVACGTANLLTVGPGVCRRADIDRLLPQVQISRVE